MIAKRSRGTVCIFAFSSKRRTAQLFADGQPTHTPEPTSACLHRTFWSGQEGISTCTPFCAHAPACGKGSMRACRHARLMCTCFRAGLQGLAVCIPFFAACFGCEMLKEHPHTPVCASMRVVAPPCRTAGCSWAAPRLASCVCAWRSWPAPQTARLSSRWWRCSAPAILPRHPCPRCRCAFSLGTEGRAQPMLQQVH